MSSLAIDTVRHAGVYPQAADVDEGKFERLVSPATGFVTRTLRSRQARFQPIIELIDTEGRELRHNSDTALHDLAWALRPALRSSQIDERC